MPDGRSDSVVVETATVRADWTWEDLVLACDLVAQNEWSGVRATDPQAVELSQLLRRLDIHPRGSRSPAFRSPNSVQRKTYDIATQRDDYSGQRTRGGHGDRRVLEAFLADPDGCTSRPRSCVRLRLPASSMI